MCYIHSEMFITFIMQETNTYHYIQKQRQIGHSGIWVMLVRLGALTFGMGGSKFVAWGLVIFQNGQKKIGEV